MITTLAPKLGEDTLKEIQKLEKEVGYPLLVFSFYDLKPAEIDSDKLAKIQEYEKGKCICLLAVEP